MSHTLHFHQKILNNTALLWLIVYITLKAVHKWNMYLGKRVSVEWVCIQALVKKTVCLPQAFSGEQFWSFEVHIISETFLCTGAVLCEHSLNISRARNQLNIRTTKKTSESKHTVWDMQVTEHKMTISPEWCIRRVALALACCRADTHRWHSPSEVAFRW